MLKSSFYKLKAHAPLPIEISKGMPDLLFCVINDGQDAFKAGSSECLVSGTDITNGEETCLISVGTDGTPVVYFDINGTIDNILLEEYRDELSVSIEMKLPFNYSRFPNKLKKIAKELLRFRSSLDNRIPFPSLRSPFAVEWLTALRKWAKIEDSSRSLASGWPSDYRASVIISHDIDTDWAFNNFDYIKRFCDMEEELGYKGVWYCVPYYCKNKKAEHAIRYLIDRGNEIGCHGYNHDAKIPLLSWEKRRKRYNVIKAFVNEWDIKGFRSEWLWRNKVFLQEISEIFDYDSTVPSHSVMQSARTFNGCGTCFPYRTYGDMVEIPLTLPMDEEWRAYNMSQEAFWNRQVKLSDFIISLGGTVVISIHPQPQQSANESSIELIGRALKEISKNVNLWKTTPYEIYKWMVKTEYEEHS
jgi:peptidoglycan/xylan/chitin deacetylase (PgdA/CDA1 family)